MNAGHIYDAVATKSALISFNMETEDEKWIQKHQVAIIKNYQNFVVSNPFSQEINI